MHFPSLPRTKLGEAWRQNEQVQITIFPSQLFLSKTSIYWIHLVQWSLGFRGISLFALQERERGSTKRFSKFAERDAKRNARDLYENGSQILNIVDYKKTTKVWDDSQHSCRQRCKRERGRTIKKMTPFFFDTSTSTKWGGGKNYWKDLLEADFKHPHSDPIKGIALHHSLR